MRFAVIILALLAMIVGPVSGPVPAHAVDVGVSATGTTESDCGHGLHVGALKPGTAHGPCDDGGATCMDANGCRHLGCVTGGPVPVAMAPVSPAAGPAMPAADADRPDGLDIAPLLDPPRPLA
ncbi:hypothetical protein [Chthonobacter albigriseus]|uniref:hypothetical protein n=1 Tax=Chthonobacter albigriseus TaxID=1683161 RepID=UPI0015EF183B|nr:hypothetical protein [Chthonobacter albigriseus]